MGTLVRKTLTIKKKQWTIKLNRFDFRKGTIETVKSMITELPEMIQIITFKFIEEHLNFNNPMAEGDHEHDGSVNQTQHNLEVHKSPKIDEEAFL